MDLLTTPQLLHSACMLLATSSPSLKLHDAVWQRPAQLLRQLLLACASPAQQHQLPELSQYAQLAHMLLCVGNT